MSAIFKAISFKYNAEEILLIKDVKSQQDALHLLEFNFKNAMEEGTRSAILVAST